MQFLKIFINGFVLLAWLLLVLPIFIVILKYQGAFSFIAVIINTLAFTLMLSIAYCWLSKINKVIAASLIFSIFIISFFIRFILGFVYDFSGRGFSSEFFAHLSWQAFEIGLSDYAFIFFSAIFLLLILSIFLLKLLMKLECKNNLILFVFFLFALLIVSFNKTQVPEWQFYQAFSQYYFSEIKTLKPEEAKKQARKVLKNLRPNLPFPIDKKDLVVSTSKKPKNVIIIYLESFSDMLSNNDKFPGLTPNIDKLKKENFSFKNNFSSAYVTIEGIANSQCGTLIDMDNGNNSLLKKAGRLTKLPCLGDVLNKAGYKQVYMGGADLGFAGKGSFLQEHGYDKLKGLNHWKKLGFKTNNWGLVDNTLYDEAIKEIHYLTKQTQPYNLTILTLGTHIPGFTYEGCQPYNTGKNNSLYLDAIYCTDYLLGKFIRQLKKEKLLDNTLVYIQGDHSIFPTHELTEIFKDQTTDRKILTIVIDDSLKKDWFGETKHTSTFNLVSNVLDLLHIKHNVNFTFAQSDFSKDKINQDYFITRYIDYDGKNIITNAFSRQDCVIKDEITTPLDACEKKQVMQSIYQLNASYSIENNKPIDCKQGVELSVNPYNNLFTINWGGKNITTQFYSRGRRITNDLPGFYLIELNPQDEIIQQHFFLDRDEEMLKRLNKFLVKNTGRFLLFSNLTTNQIKGTHLSNLPSYFHKNKWLYADLNNGVIKSINNQEKQLGKIKFLPISCNREFKILSFNKRIELDTPNDSGFCPIKAWGPKETIYGQSFNTQASGLSAFWLKTDCIPKGTTFRINGKTIKTHINLPVITAAINDEELFSKIGKYTIELYHSDSKKSQFVGEFNVSDVEIENKK